MERYVLESGGVLDGYLLEDGSGVLLLEEQPTFMKKAAFFATLQSLLMWIVIPIWEKI